MQSPRLPNRATTVTACQVGATLLALVALACVCAPARAAPAATLTDVTFLAPLEGFGTQPARYRISAKVVFSKPVTGRIVRATLDGTEVFDAGAGSRNPRIDTFDRDQQHLGGEFLTGQREVYVQLYERWRSGKKYQLGVTVRLDGGEHLSCKSRPAVAPAGGVWRSLRPRFKVISVQETAGLARKGWPVIVGVALDAEEVGDPTADLALVQFDKVARQYRQLPFQVLGTVRPAYVGENVEASEGKPSPLEMIELCFLADLEAHGQNRYALYYGAPGTRVFQPKAACPALDYYPNATGLSVDTGPAAFSFDAKTGQLLSYTPKLAGCWRARDFRQGPIHWNPDVWAPPSSWGHTVDWDLRGPDAPQVVERRGPLAYRVIRAGTLPHSNGVKATVSYTLFAGMPFVLESSLLEFTAVTRVNAVRNNELVFRRGVHTHAAWPGRQGRVQVRRCYDPWDPTHFYGIVQSHLPADISWVALYNDRRRYGIGIVNLSGFHHSGAAPWRQDLAGAHYYFNDYGGHGTGRRMDMNFTYISRLLVGRSVVPAGALFGESSAFVAFRLDEEQGQLRRLRRWSAMLHQPPVVQVQ